MDPRWMPFIVCLLSFLLGSIPFGLLIARIFKVPNLTTKGSGNIGATNVARVVGIWPAGALTFLLDGLKGALPVFLGSPDGVRLLMGVFGGATDVSDGGGETLAWAAGFFAVLGHCYSPWMQFRGGKGVATGFGAALLLSPVSALIGISTFAFVFAARRIASLASIAGLLMTTVAQVVLQPIGSHLGFGAAMIAVILFRHEANLDALLENREKPLR